MPRLNASPDARDGGAPSSDVYNCHPALKPCVSRSVSLVRRVTPRGSRIAIDGTDFSVFRYWPSFLSRVARGTVRERRTGREERL